MTSALLDTLPAVVQALLSQSRKRRTASRRLGHLPAPRPLRHNAVCRPTPQLLPPERGGGSPRLAVLPSRH